LNIIQDSFDIAIKINVALQFIQELALHCIFGNEAVLCIVFCDHARTVSFHVRNTEGNVVQAVKIVLGKTSEVGPGNIARTFNEVTRD
jgi:hypothetical protein